MTSIDVEIAAFGAAVSWVVSVAIVWTTRWHGTHTLDWTFGIQKFHLVPTPRVGGLSVMCGLLAVYVGANAGLCALLGPIVVAGLPALCLGVAEDLTKKVKASTRLLATFISGMLGCLLTGASITRLEIPGVDLVLASFPLAVLFTAFTVAGVANAVNIIDGFNGLASGTAIICFATLGAIAHNCGDVALTQLCYACGGVTLGFFVLNFPLGRLFLGDGGAYLLGFLMAWLGVMLSYRNPSVSVWAPLLTCCYPVFETVFTIIRRLQVGSHPFEPDDRHLHSLIKVGLVLRLYPHLRADLRNALVAPFSWCLAAVPAILAVQYAGSTNALVVVCLLSFTIYLGVYRYVTAASRRERLAEVLVLPAVHEKSTLEKRRGAGGAE
jgi:UDP-N-acetylmuramyl pentapeptide phosphotransferase/UDP-N-acetylglucosamine-1-phosphate transferase